MMIISVIGSSQPACAIEQQEEAAKQYDVIVVGSDPEGVTAATTAASYGQEVLLIDTRAYAGGLYTSGMLSMLDLNYKDASNLTYVNEGAFQKFYDAVGVAASFDIDQAQAYFHDTLAAEGVDTVWEAQNIRPVMEATSIQGITYQKEGKTYTVEGSVVIDAVPDAPIARASGASYYLGREDIGSDTYAAATLVFGVEGVDWERVRNYLDYDGSIYTGSTDNAAWGYAELLDYKPVTSERFQLRALNLSKQTDGEVIINAFQIFDVDALDRVNQYEAYEMALEELAHIISYLRAHAEGFEEARLGRVAEELYLREGVRIVGLQTLRAEDAFNNTNFSDKIAYGSYPMDLQSTKVDEGGGTILTGRNLYTIPMGVMLPAGVDGLLVVGRSASYDSIVHSSARTVPVGMAVAEAAGVLATYANWSGQPPRFIYEQPFLVKMVQEMLRIRGVALDTPLPTLHPEHTHWSYPAIQGLRNQALLSKERAYQNDYACDVPATRETLESMIRLIAVNTELPIQPLTLPTEQAITREEAVMLISQALGGVDRTLEELLYEGVFTLETVTRLYKEPTFVNGHLYLMVHDAAAYLRETYEMPIAETSDLIHNDSLISKP